MSKRVVLNLIVAVFVLVGAILSILDRVFPPRYIQDMSSCYPDSLRTVGWLFLLIPSLVRISIDLFDLFKTK